MAPLASIESALIRLGVAHDDPASERVQSLLDAVSSEIRAMTQRDLEGTATLYAEELPVHEGIAALPHVPVSSVLSVAAVAWDHLEDPILDPLDVAGAAATTLAATAAVGDTNLKVASVAGVAVGDLMRVGPASTREVVRVTVVGTAGSGGTGLTMEPALRYAQASGQPVVEVNGSEVWRLISARSGRLEIRSSLTSRGRLDTDQDASTRARPVGPPFARVVWRTSGDVPVHVREATLDWVQSRWPEVRDLVRTGLVAYKTGDDSETYGGGGGMAGTAPASVLRTLALESHLSGAVI